MSRQISCTLTHHCLCDEVNACRHQRRLDQVSAAFAELMERVIPTFACELLATSVPLPVRVGDLDNFISLLHSAGINVRHLGYVRQHLRALCEELRRPEHLMPPAVVTSRKPLRFLTKLALTWQKLIIIEAVARILKNELRAQFRATMAAQRGCAEEPFRCAAVALINDRFGANAAADDFWSGALIEQLCARFPRALSEEDARSARKRAPGAEANLKRLMRPWLSHILLRFCALAGLQLEEQFGRQLTELAHTTFQHQEHSIAPDQAAAAILINRQSGVAWPPTPAEQVWFLLPTPLLLVL